MLTNFHNLRLLQIHPTELEGPGQTDPPGWLCPSGSGGADLVYKEFLQEELWEWKLSFPSS